MGDDAYLALPKGSIMPHHVLILPLDHILHPPLPSSPCGLEIQKLVLLQFNDAQILIFLFRYKTGIKNCFLQSNEHTIFFERNVKTQFGFVHYHIQAVPISTDFSVESILSHFTEYSSKTYQISFITITDREKSVQDYVKSYEEYFLAELPDGTRLLNIVSGNRRHPLQLGREVIVEIIGQPERKNWKSCALSKQEEIDLATQFKKKFYNFDFNNK